MERAFNAWQNDTQFTSMFMCGHGRVPANGESLDDLDSRLAPTSEYPKGDPF